ncbi:hypothetical protein EBU95_07610, partial [bacterium]|nr:hypothetical protein [bacterium]
NSKNTGTACSFSVNPKDESIWSSLIKQSSWNETKKIGSFSENQNNPNKSVKIKFSLTEAAGLLDALERQAEFSAYHNSEKQSTQIKLSPYIKDNKQVGYSYIVNKTDKQNSENKQSYLIGFYFNEAKLLSEFLRYSLNTIFETQRIESIKKMKNQPKQSPKDIVKSEDIEDGDLW